jgi:hypothetical protein
MCRDHDDVRPDHTFSASVYGDTVDELRFAALDQAREVFGPHVPMTVESGFHVSVTLSGRAGSYNNPQGKKLVACPTVKIWPLGHVPRRELNA